MLNKTLKTAGKATQNNNTNTEEKLEKMLKQMKKKKRRYFKYRSKKVLSRKFKNYNGSTEKHL